MRVLHVTATYPPTINGVAIAAATLKEELEKLDCAVTVLAPKNPRLAKSETGVIRYPSFPNPLVKDYPAPLLPGLKAIVKKLGLQKPDIVHTHHPFTLGYFSKDVADYYRVPLVFTYHTRYGDYAQNYFPFIPADLKAKIVQKSVDDFCKECDLVISPSRSIAKEISAKFPQIKVAVIPSGLTAIPRVNKTKKKIREILSVDENKVVLLTVCRLAREKNLNLLIESVGRLGGNFILFLVGGGPYEGEITNLVEKKGLAGRVRLVGPVQHGKLGIYYQAADIFVWPSVTETQGLILLEALSFGLPIAAVESEASRDWVGADVGILTANDPKRLAEAVKQLAKRDKKAISRKAQTVAAKHTSAEKAKEVLSAYKALKRLGQEK